MTAGRFRNKNNAASGVLLSGGQKRGHAQRGVEIEAGRRPIERKRSALQ